MRGIMKSKLFSILLAATIFGGIAAPTAVTAAPKKKVYTITDRQVELRSKVDAAFKHNELTLKQADGLRGDLDDINGDIEKMKSKNGGKLSYKDEGKVEKRLNKVSLSLTKWELQKRATPH
jgi:hypothetical protein